MRTPHHGNHRDTGDQGQGRPERRRQPTARRRQELLRLLRASGAPLLGADLARQLGVSRTAVGLDMAILRAGGRDIITTHQGYVLRTGGAAGAAGAAGAPAHAAVVQVQHDRTAIREEASVLVDLGLRILDECVAHPILGRLCGPLSIASRQEARDYVATLERTGTGPLLERTGGHHSHTIDTPRPDLLDQARQELRRRGYWADEG